MLDCDWSSDVCSSDLALTESEARMKIFIEHAPAGLAMFDAEMRYIAASRRWRVDYGVDDDFIGKSHYELQPHIPARWREAHQAGLAGRIVCEDQDCYVRPDGARQWLRWEIHPWRTAEGAVGGIVIFAENMTRYHDALEEIRSLNAALEARVEQRTAELRAANEELESFSYAVAHDLRAPLRAMGGFASALLEDHGAQLLPDAKAHLNEIIVASSRMGELIDGLLALSRATHGEIRAEAIDLSALAGRLLWEIAQRDPSRRVATVVEKDMSFTGDPRMIDIALRNLLDNAWKYTAKTPEPEIRVYSERRRGKLWFCVADNGAGFNAAYADKLFQPFQRLHRTDEFPGIGIGLATVQRVVRRLGGEIEASGAPGAGATFAFTVCGATGAGEQAA
jgi:PAS domain S-box-containing protein